MNWSSASAESAGKRRVSRGRSEILQTTWGHNGGATHGVGQVCDWESGISVGRPSGMVMDRDSWLWRGWNRDELELCVGRISGEETRPFSRGRSEILKTTWLRKASATHGVGQVCDWGSGINVGCPDGMVIGGESWLRWDWNWDELQFWSDVGRTPGMGAGHLPPLTQPGLYGGVTALRCVGQLGWLKQRWSRSVFEWTIYNSNYAKTTVECQIKCSNIRACTNEELFALFYSQYRLF